MILELDTDLLEKVGNLTLNQLVFLTLVLDNNQKSSQGIKVIVSLIDDTEVQELIERDLIKREESLNNIVYTQTDTLTNLIKEDKEMFDEFFELYPVQVCRPDGTDGFLRKNKNNCRKKYKSVVGKSKAVHQHLISCLKYELDDKARTGKLGYLKTMWKWLTTAEWENSEEQMKASVNDNNMQQYGTKLI